MRRLTTTQVMEVYGWTSRDTVIAREKSGFLPPAMRDIPRGPKYWLESEILERLNKQASARGEHTQGEPAAATA